MFVVWRPFQIQGHLSKETGKYHWGETLQDAYYKNYEQPEVYSTALVNGRQFYKLVHAATMGRIFGIQCRIPDNELSCNQNVL